MKTDQERLNHILDAIAEIELFTQHIDYNQYYKDRILQLALIKLLEIIGEAAANVTEETKKEFSEVEWKTLKSVRNILVHEYFGIDYKIVWKAIKEKIPELKIKIIKILESKFNSPQTHKRRSQ